jgi:hypothetical protein
MYNNFLSNIYLLNTKNKKERENPCIYGRGGSHPIGEGWPNGLVVALPVQYRKI